MRLLHRVQAGLAAAAVRVPAVQRGLRLPGLRALLRAQGLLRGMRDHLRAQLPAARVQLLQEQEHQDRQVNSETKRKKYPRGLLI